jgi:hypothetical protein
MEASNAQYRNEPVRMPERSSLNVLRDHLMDLELWGLLLIGSGLFLFA